MVIFSTRKRWLLFLLRPRVTRARAVASRAPASSVSSPESLRRQANRALVDIVFVARCTAGGRRSVVVVVVGVAASSRRREGDADDCNLGRRWSARSLANRRRCNLCAAVVGRRSRRRARESAEEDEESSVVLATRRRLTRVARNCLRSSRRGRYQVFIDFLRHYTKNPLLCNFANTASLVFANIGPTLWTIGKTNP